MLKQKEHNLQRWLWPSKSWKAVGKNVLFEHYKRGYYPLTPSYNNCINWILLGWNSSVSLQAFIYLFLKFYLFIYFTILYWFCHTSISHGCTCVPHPEPPSHLPPHPIPQGHPSAPALSTLSHAPNLDQRFISHMIIYVFQCHSPISSRLCPLPQSPKDCSIHLCLFCCLAYRVIITIFLNSIYMH